MKKEKKIELIRDILSGHKSIHDALKDNYAVNNMPLLIIDRDFEDGEERERLYTPQGTDLQLPRDEYLRYQAKRDIFVTIIKRDRETVNNGQYFDPPKMIDV